VVSIWLKKPGEFPRDFLGEIEREEVKEGGGGVCAGGVVVS